MVFEELLLRYAAGERDFTGIKVTRASPFIQFRDWDLKGVDLSGAIFRDGNLQQIALWMQGLNLSGADLTHLDLAYAHLEKANLSRAKI